MMGSCTCIVINGFHPPIVSAIRGSRGHQNQAVCLPQYECNFQRQVADILAGKK